MARENLAWIAAIFYGLHEGHVNEVARDVLHERPFSRDGVAMSPASHAADAFVQSSAKDSKNFFASQNESRVCTYEEGFQKGEGIGRNVIIESAAIAYGAHLQV